MDKVYIIVVNYNNYWDTIECVETLLKSTYKNYQIFIVDNSASDVSENQFCDWAGNNNYKGITTTFARLTEPLEIKPINFTIVSESHFSNGHNIYEDKIVIVRSENRGFAAANNIVLNYILKNATDSSLIWILNNDTVVEKDTLGNLIEGYEKNINGKYIFASKLKYYDRPDVIQAVAGKYNKWLGKHRHIGDGELDKGQYDNFSFGNLNYIVGASIFLPKVFLEKAGVMCEDYFLYFEELDWIKEAANNGFKAILVPNAVVYHKEGSSIVEFNKVKKDTSLAEYYSITSRVRFIKKWYPLCLITISPGVVLALVKRILQGRFKLVKKILVSLFQILFSIKSSTLKYEND
jgi:GT2 family glycosyltransferase